MSEPVRFFNAFTFYPVYLQDFYRKHPELIRASHREQTAALIRSGFSDCHIVSPVLARMGWTTMDVIANDPISQGTWAREQGLSELSGGTNLAEITRRQIQSFRPTIAYTNDIINLNSAFFQSLDQKPPVVAAWRGFEVPRGFDLSAFDLILTSFDRTIAEATAAGARKVVRFIPGFPDDHPALAEPREIKWDVVFSGTITRHHQRRIQIVEYLCRVSQDPLTGFRFGLFMPDVSALSPMAQRLNQGARWAHDMIRLLRSARIVVNTAVDGFDAQPPNMRLIEATGAGAFLLQPFHPGLAEFFEPGLEVETYRTENELMAKIAYYLGDPAACDEIAARGHARCMSERALSVSARHFKSIMESELAARPR